VGNLNDMRVEYERVGYLARRDAARAIAGRPPDGSAAIRS